MSRWSEWVVDEPKGFFSSFLKEGMSEISGDPKEIANREGWVGDKFGW